MFMMQTNCVGGAGMGFKDLGLVIIREDRYIHLLVQVDRFILNCEQFGGDGSIYSFYINEYVTDDVAKRKCLECKKRRYYSLDEVARTINDDIKYAKEISIYDINKTFHACGTYYLYEQEMLSLYYFLNRKYCIECGVKLTEEKEKCWACEHGI